MARGGKISGKCDFKKKVRSKEGNSDDSDEDYVVSDEGREASDYYCSSLDGCASEESLDNLIEEEEEFKAVRNFNRSKATIGICGRRKKGSTKSRKRGRIVYADEEGNDDDEEEEEKKEESENLEEDEDEEYKVEEDEEEYNEEEEEDIQVIANKTSQKRRRITRAEQLEEEEEEEIQGKRNFSRSKVKNGVCDKQGNASKTPQKGRRITNAEQLEEEEEVERTRHEEEEDEEWERDGDGDEDEEEEDFECDDEDDEFTPVEEDCSDEEEEISGKMKKSNGTKMGKKVFPKSAYVASTRGQKRRSSRASKKPTKSKRSMKGRLRRKVKGDDEDDFMDNGPVIVTRSRKKQGWKRRRLLLSDSDCVASGSSDFEYTISEEEREQVREAKELCGSLRDNLRSSSILINIEEARVHEDLHQQQKPLGRKGKEKIEEPQGRKGKVKGEDLKSVVGKQVCGICLSEEGKRRIRGVLNCCTHYFCFACIMEWAKVESRCPLCKQRFKTISKPARSTGVDLREAVIQVPERDQVIEFFLMVFAVSLIYCS